VSGLGKLPRQAASMLSIMINTPIRMFIWLP